MPYKILPSDTLSKIAKKFGVPLKLILAHNPSIKNANRIFPGQFINIPNVEDVPNDEFAFSDTHATDVIARAKSAINKGIRYKLGSGGMKPKLALPSDNKLCDCSGFVCWVFGLSRQTDIPFYKKFGGWIYTDAMVEDIKSTAGIFERIDTPEVGCIVVYGAGIKIGHVGIVSKVNNGEMTKVIHCSSGNDRHFSDAIQETAPDVFNRPDTLWGRFTAI